MSMLGGEATAPNDERERRRVEAFNMMAPAALSFIATDGPISMTLWSGNEAVGRLGHNRGVWPGRMLKGTGRGDPAKRSFKTYAFSAKTQCRLWTRTKAERDRIAEPVLTMIERASERDGGLAELENGFRDMGPQLDLEMLGLEMRGIATDLGIRCWDDAGLIHFLDRVLERAGEITRKARSGRYSPLEVALTQELGK